MTYTSRVPAAPLNAYVDDLYCLDGPAPYRRQMVFPIPAAHLMFNLGEAFQVSVGGQAEPQAVCTESWWVGQWNRYHIVDWPRHPRLFGVHFKPGGSFPFLRLPLSELHNQAVPLEALWGTGAAEIREQLFTAPTISAALLRLEQALLARHQPAPHGLAVVEYARAAIAQQHGALSIRDLSERIGISQNHLSHQFKRMVGLPPKELARLYRFGHVLRSIDPAQPADWTWVAHQSGFYDQAHFNKEFVALTGHSPSAYLRARRRWWAEHPEQPESLGLLPLD